MKKFINREKELEFLEEQYRSKGSNLVVIYGRRRVGKTTLIQQFIKNKPHLYFFADKQLEKELIARFQEVAGVFLNDSLFSGATFKSWDELFAHFCRQADFSRKVVLVIDEFQNLAKVNAAFPSIFQRLWDEKLKKLNIFVILAGSLVGMMYDLTLSYSSPLYGRRTGDFALLPIAFDNYRYFFPKINFNRLLEFYAIIGGVPKYIETFQNSGGLWTNINRQILQKGSLLYNEPRFVLNEEITETITYFSILKIIAGGEHKIGKIAEKLEIKTNQLTNYLNVLLELNILERQVPVTEDKPHKSKKGLYFIKDNFFNFWFRFVFPQQSALEIGDVDLAQKEIKIKFDQYVAGIYEQICPAIWRLAANNGLALKLEKIGRWWNKNEEIDFVGLNEVKREIVFGEAKWSAKKVGIDVYQELKRKAALVEWRDNQRKEFFALFSKSGFTDKMRQVAKQEKVYLFCGERMVL